MEVDTSENPWNVENVEDFLYFCCPECDERNQSKDLFLQHAFDNHPNSKHSLLKASSPNKVKIEDNEESITSEICRTKVKVEMQETKDEDDYESL